MLDILATLLVNPSPSLGAEWHKGKQSMWAFYKLPLIKTRASELNLPLIKRFYRHFILRLFFFCFVFFFVLLSFTFKISKPAVFSI